MRLSSDFSARLPWRSSWRPPRRAATEGARGRDGEPLAQRLADPADDDAVGLAGSGERARLGADVADLDRACRPWARPPWAGAAGERPRCPRHGVLFSALRTARGLGASFRSRTARADRRWRSPTRGAWSALARSRGAGCRRAWRRRRPPSWSRARASRPYRGPPPPTGSHR